MTDRKQTTTTPAGASALREYERRRAGRKARAGRRFGSLGAALVGLVSEPQSTRAWKDGSEAECHVAGALERRLRGHDAVLLHDRRIPYGGNIDHLAITSSGVTVIDTKSSHGRVQLSAVGGILSHRRELLVINGRDGTRELHKLDRQLEVIQAALDAGGFYLVPIRGVLCYPNADGIPRLGALHTQTGITITHPRGAAKLARRPGPLNGDAVHKLAEQLGRRFRPADHGRDQGRVVGAL